MKVAQMVVELVYMSGIEMVVVLVLLLVIVTVAKSEHLWVEKMGLVSGPMMEPLYPKL